LNFSLLLTTVNGRCGALLDGRTLVDIDVMAREIIGRIAVG
jgi:hypothetical protein